jgi:hypothetical protein
MLTLPISVLFLVGYKYLRRSDLIQNGYIAAYAIIATFLTATKANSIFNFLFGLFRTNGLFTTWRHSWHLSFPSFVATSHASTAVVIPGDSSGDGGSRDVGSVRMASQFTLRLPSPQVWEEFMGREESILQEPHHCMPHWFGGSQLLSRLPRKYFETLVVFSHIHGTRRHYFWIYALDWNSGHGSCLVVWTSSSDTRS